MVRVLAVAEQMSTILVVNRLGALPSATSNQVPIRSYQGDAANE